MSYSTQHLVNKSHLVVAEGRVVLDNVHVAFGDHGVAISVKGVEVVNMILAYIYRYNDVNV